MARTWDRRTARGLTSWRDELVRDQVRHAVAPFSPLWRQRFLDLGRTPDSIHTVADLASLPALGERDICPDGDPAGMASLVLQVGESGYALHASGPDLRHALRLRLTHRDDYRRVVEADTRPTSYVFAGLGFRYPLASTRADLDVLARAGARLWGVLGLTRNDVMVSAVPVAATTEHTALQYAALAAGAPAVFPGVEPEALAAAIRLTPPTVLAVPSGTAVAVLSSLDELRRVRTLLLVGAPTERERQSATEALRASGAATEAVVLAVHAPNGARLLWGECRESGGTTGLHTYPDLDVVQLVDPDSGDPQEDGVGELVLSQLGMRGSALLRWRTGDVVSGVAATPCPSCGRRVARVQGVHRGALVAPVDRPPAMISGQQAIDLRAVAAALTALPGFVDWRIVAGARQRDGAGQVLVHVVGSDDDADLVVQTANEVRAVAGSMPSQIVVCSQPELESLAGTPLSRHMLVRPTS